jgi:hypothetical protein
LKPNDDNSDLRGYLLGTTPLDRRTEIEDGLTSDSDLYQELLIAEDELIDQYVAGELTSQERQQFEANFLITVDRQRQFRFGRNLRRYLNSHKTPSPLISSDSSDSQLPGQPSGSQLFSFRSLARNPIVLVLVIIVLGLGAFAALRLSRMRLAKQIPMQTIELALTPRVNRSVSQIQAAPQASKNVRLKLELNSGNFPSYKAELLKGGETVSVREGLTAETEGEHRVVAFDVPGETLEPADYQIKLSGNSDSGENETVDRYCFRILAR